MPADICSTRQLSCHAPCANLLTPIHHDGADGVEVDGQACGRSCGQDGQARTTHASSARTGREGGQAEDARGGVDARSAQSGLLDTTRHVSLAGEPRRITSTVLSEHRLRVAHVEEQVA